MKFCKILIFTVTIFSFLSFQEVPSIEGKWQLFRTEDADGYVEESSEIWMHFKKNGVLEGGDVPGKTTRTGTWSYDHKTKKLTFGSEKNLSGEGTHVIHWIDANTIHFTVQNELKVYMKRMKEA